MPVASLRLLSPSTILHPRRQTTTIASHQKRLANTSGGVKPNNRGWCVCRSHVLLGGLLIISIALSVTLFGQLPPEISSPPQHFSTISSRSDQLILPVFTNANSPPSYWQSILRSWWRFYASWFQRPTRTATTKAITTTMALRSPPSPLLPKSRDTKLSRQYHSINTINSTSSHFLDSYAAKRLALTKFEQQLRLRHNDTRPDISTMVQNDQLIGTSSQRLHDLAIIGFGKCGTSTLLYWLRRHQQIQLLREEVWDLVQARPAELVRKLYHHLKWGDAYIRGHKCPGEIVSPHVLQYYRTHWPRTKLLIGIRHPVRWFESLYNFRVQNLETNETLPPPSQLVGRCTAARKQTCTDRGNFAYHLLRLGKQHWNTSANVNYMASNNHTVLSPPRPPSTLEQQIIGKHPRGFFVLQDVPYLPNPVFLYDISQLADTNATRQALLRRDLARFLQLTLPLPPMVPYRPSRIWTPSEQARRDARKINICDNQYANVREELMRLSRPSATWIANVFIHLPTIVVSSREFLVHELRHHWQKDPCEPAFVDADR